MTITRNTGNGFITGTTLGSATTTYTYNTYGEVGSYTAKYGATALFNTLYTRDVLGRITRKVETLGGVATTYDYQYDTAGRLIGASKNGLATASYAYDNNGNRINATVNGVSTQGYYDLKDRLTTYGNNSYTYTANGELLTKTNVSGTTTYAYDVMGNLVFVTMPDGTLIEYVIDGQNRRVGKKINGMLTHGYLYKDQLEPVAELDDTGNVVTTFIYGTKANSPDFMVKSGVTYRVISDHLGSIRMVVDMTTGAIAQQIDYDEWGNIENDSNPGFQPFGFAGGLFDHDTMLVRFGTRDYDAKTGRWMAKDPIRFDGADDNLYGYIKSDAINKTDPSGLISYVWMPCTEKDVEECVASCHSSGKEYESCRRRYITLDLINRTVLRKSTLSCSCKDDDDDKPNIPPPFIPPLVCPLPGRGGSSGGCFVAGTLVLTDSGYKNIEEIRLGDVVLAWDEMLRQNKLERVVGLVVALRSDLVRITVSLSDDDIIASPNHKFYVLERGWLKASEIKEGYRMIDSNNNVIAVNSISTVADTKEINVYNIEVEGLHTYYVGKRKVLTHNRLMKAPE
ncbi:MAG: hypothetical protein HQK86_15155 [Nitrospinae bacterium]|nr:hypothetical protein [Nitrospinota bacterium]